ncbi:unnamed protein product, partial [Mesorhabditis spiculigera]
MFLRSAIEKILADKDIKKKDNLQLKKACETALEELNNESKTDRVPNAADVLPDREIFEADRYFLPFELACRSKSPRIVTNALDCLQKLIAYGHLTGRRVDSANPERLLIDRIIEAICDSFNGPGTDETVLLQIIKAILAAVLSQQCEVHEASLLLAVRTCFTIYLATRSPINGATAKGTLTQIINTVFGQMEKHGAEKDDKSVVREVVDGLVGQVVAEQEADDAAVDAKSRAGASTCGDSESGTNQSLIPSEDSFPNVYQKDAYLVFRAMCFLAQKDEGDVGDKGNTFLRSKVLALELLLLVLQNSSEAIRQCPPFLLLIKKTLCLALTKNAVSPVVQVFEKSLAIFVQLVDKFKGHLKLQIEVFFKEIIITMLESSTCSFEQKWIVLNTIDKIMENPQSIVDMYVNYDCDMTAANVFENLVNVVSRTSRTTVSEHSHPDQRKREQAFRLLGLKCLVMLLRCQVEWFEGITPDLKEKLEKVNGESETTSDEQSSCPALNAFEHTKQKKDLIEQGILMFARKPKLGLQFLQEKGFLGTEPIDIALFMIQEERLDKTVVGDYLGDPDEFNKKVMYAYIDDFDFSEKWFVDALRMFLEKFRLPGEAQKIDRLMEKFASRYCECNPSFPHFASADTAYVVAYSIIMLTTDLHSHQVKAANKMSKEAYVRQCRGINNGGDLPAEFLERIYDDILNNEIKMKAGAAKLLKSQQNTFGGGASTDAQRKAMADVEMAAMKETARALMESVWNADANFTPASHQHHVRPMFKICWTPCLAAFSMGLQSSEDHDEWMLCLTGFRLGIRAACLLRMNTERDSYIKAISRFTLLTSNKQLMEMREKNIEAIKLLLLIGDEDGDYLEDNWVDVLRCLSQLELAQLIGGGLRQNGGDIESSAHYVIKNTGTIDQRTLAALQEALGETSSQAVVVAVDRIFHGSSKLSPDAIVAFVRALCAVSKEELGLSGSPRMYLLRMLVDVAFYNMNRIRLHWTRIWAVMSEHFSTAGCNQNEAIASFAVDAIRQLAIKFLERGELPNFRFQHEFFKPFETISQKTRSAQTKDLVVSCCAHIVEAHAPRIKSGWKPLFQTWNHVAADNYPDIAERAFLDVKKVIENHFATDFLSALDAFQEMVKCLSDFACNSCLNQDINMEAIHLIRILASYVSQNGDAIVDAPYEEKFAMAGRDRIWLRGYFPALFELSCIIKRSSLDLRTRSLTVMFDIIRSHGAEFQEQWWTEVLKIIFTIFDPTKFDDSNADKREWVTTTCNHALLSVVDVFYQYFDVLAPTAMPIIYDKFAACIHQDNENLARTTVNCLEDLVKRNGTRFTPDMWERTVKLIASLFQNTLPEELLSWDEGRPSTSSMTEMMQQVNINGHVSPAKSQASDHLISAVLVHCVVQSELVDAVTSIVLGTTRNQSEPGHSPLATSPPNGIHEGLFDTMRPQHLLVICDALADSQRLARHFNEKNAQRTLLWKAGLRGTTKPNLMRQETHALRAMLAILLRLLGDRRSAEIREQVGQSVLRAVNEALAGYNESINDEKRRAAYTPVVCELLTEVLRLPTEWLHALGEAFPERLCDLVQCAEGEQLRSLLAQALRRFLREAKASTNGAPVATQKSASTLSTGPNTTSMRTASTLSFVARSPYVETTSVDESDADLERREMRVFDGESSM